MNNYLKRVMSFTLVVVMIVIGMPKLTINTIKAATAQATIYEEDGCKIDFKVNSQWDSGFEGQFIIKNTSSSKLQNWRFSIKFGHEITSIWDGEIDSKTSTGYTIKCPRWNTDIAPNGTAIVGFIAKSDGDIKNPVEGSLDNEIGEINKEKYAITYKTTSDWGSAFNGEICIKNNSDTIIENWKLTFDFDKEINYFWTADILEQKGQHYIAGNVGFNSNIYPGQTIRLGFEGKKGNVKNQPSNYRLYGMVTENIPEDDNTTGNEDSGNTENTKPEIVELPTGAVAVKGKGIFLKEKNTIEKVYSDGIPLIFSVNDDYSVTISSTDKMGSVYFRYNGNDDSKITITDEGVTKDYRFKVKALTKATIDIEVYDGDILFKRYTNISDTKNVTTNGRVAIGGTTVAVEYLIGLIVSIFIARDVVIYIEGEFTKNGYDWCDGAVAAKAISKEKKLKDLYYPALINTKSGKAYIAFNTPINEEKAIAIVVSDKPLDLYTFNSKKAYEIIKKAGFLIEKEYPEKHETKGYQFKHYHKMGHVQRLNRFHSLLGIPTIKK